MGCDIHAYAEVKQSGTWDTVGHIFRERWVRDDEITVMRAYDDDNADALEFSKGYSMHPYNGRNYTLFNVLAGVRAREELTPIAEPRGLPEDVSRWLCNESRMWGVDGHSHSWLSISELEGYEWNRFITRSGYVTPSEYRHYLVNGKPNGWCQGAAGARVVHVSNSQMDSICAGVIPDPGASYYARLEWRQRLSDACGDFVDESIPALRALMGKRRVEDVRMVFWFDN